MTCIILQFCLLLPFRFDIMSFQPRGKFFFSWMENCFKLFLFAFGVTQINSEIFSVLSTSEMGKISLLREKKPFSDQNFRVFWHIMMQTRIDILIHFISENIASRG